METNISITVKSDGKWIKVVVNKDEFDTVATDDKQYIIVFNDNTFATIDKESYDRLFAIK